jgi:hypothetical protein
VAIAPQSAMTEERVRTRPPIVRSPHMLVPVEQPSPALTFAKIFGLVALAAFGTAFATAMVVGSALFMLFSLH